MESHYLLYLVTIHYLYLAHVFRLSATIDHCIMVGHTDSKQKPIPYKTAIHLNYIKQL